MGQLSCSGRASRRSEKRGNLKGEIVYGGAERDEYVSAAAGLRKFLARLANGREDEFLRACRAKAAFEKGDKYYIGRGRTMHEAVARGRVYRTHKTVTCLPGFEQRRWKWWMSEHSKNEDKWRMVKTAVEVANDRFGDGLVLKDMESASWPDKLDD